MTKQPEIATLIETAKLAAAAGGEALMHWRGRFSVREKGPADFVTDADLASQDAIQKVLAERRPEDAFVGEEQVAEEQAGVVTPPDPDRVCWVVDPLDGTTNYLHDFPCFAVSVGVVLAGEPLAGVIYDPLRKEVFSAGRGAGAWLLDEQGERRVSTSQGLSLRDSLVALSLPADVRPDAPDVIDLMAVIDRCQAIRRTGSAALNLAYVACGRLDVHWARQIMPWDVAAGVLMVREAGGVVTNASGGDFDLWRSDFLAAAHPPLHAEMAAVLTGPSC